MCAFLAVAQPVFLVDPPLPSPVRVPRVTVCNGKRFFRPSLEERAPILGPRNIVSRVRPGTKGKEKEKEGGREREREREEKKNESVQAGRMERREPFDTTRSATKRTCCGRITVHIYIYISTFFESSPLFLPAHSRAPVFHDPRIVIEYRIVRRRRFSNS